MYLQNIIGHTRLAQPFNGDSRIPMIHPEIQNAFNAINHNANPMVANRKIYYDSAAGISINQR
jgi:hypothetical protein